MSTDTLIGDDYTAEMEWLDGVAYPTTAAASKPGVARGTCATGNGAPATVESNSGSATVKYGNSKLRQQSVAEDIG